MAIEVNRRYLIPLARFRNESYFTVQEDVDEISERDQLG